MFSSKPSDYERTVYYPNATTVESLSGMGDLPEAPKRAARLVNEARRNYVRALICVALAAVVVMAFLAGALNGLGVAGRFVMAFIFVLLCVSGVHFGIQSARTDRRELPLGMRPGDGP